MSSTTKNLCYHCQQPIPRGVHITALVDEQERPMCCYGCQAVAETIAGQGLTQFYKFRQGEFGQQPFNPETLQNKRKEFEVYNDEHIQKEFVVATSESVFTATLALEGMTCAACAWLIERQLSRLPGIQKVVVNSTTERMQVTWNNQESALSDVLYAVYQIGYKALPFQQADMEEHYDQQKRDYIKRLGVAGIASMQTMAVAFGLYFDDIDATTRLYFWWVSLLFSTPVLFYSCQPFFQSAWRSLKVKTVNMDVPVSVAILLAFSISLYATITDSGNVYFECVTMFAFFLLSGRYLELLARQKAVANAANLMKLIPAITEKREQGTWVQTMVKYLQPGDEILVKPGAALPVDGVLLSEQAWCDESQLTGESRPVLHRQGDTLYAGSLNQENPIRMQVTHTQQQTSLAQIIHLQDAALGQKPQVLQLADRVSKYFVSIVLIVSLFTYVGWSFIDSDKAIWIVLSVLVATCPCALSLAAPAAMSGAVTQLNKYGILLKQANVLNALPHVQHICFDKTGTLTYGAFHIQDAWHAEGVSQEQVERVAASLEAVSEHPIAQAFHALAASEVCDEIENHPGQGIWGVVQGQAYRIGSKAFVEQWLGPIDFPIADANVFLATTGELVAAWRVDDELRDDATSIINWCHQQGYKTYMLTGDTQERALHLNEVLGIQAVRAELKPQDKLTFLEQLQQQGPVMMIGDGINDAPVLAQADVSITFAHASDLAQSGSDVIILNGQFLALKRLTVKAKKSTRIIKQNFSWAIGYNGLILPLAILGYVGPLWAMLGMSTSSLIVVSNSLRLLKNDRLTL